jgi:hypothetical protein
MKNLDLSLPNKLTAALSNLHSMYESKHFAHAMIVNLTSFRGRRCSISASFIVTYNLSSLILLTRPLNIWTSQMICSDPGCVLASSVELKKMIFYDTIR